MKKLFLNTIIEELKMHHESILPELGSLIYNENSNSIRQEKQFNEYGYKTVLSLYSIIEKFQSTQNLHGNTMNKIIKETVADFNNNNEIITQKLLQYKKDIATMEEKQNALLSDNLILLSDLETKIKAAYKNELKDTRINDYYLNNQLYIAFKTVEGMPTTLQLNNVIVNDLMQYSLDCNNVKINTFNSLKELEVFTMSYIKNSDFIINIKKQQQELHDQKIKNEKLDNFIKNLDVTKEYIFKNKNTYLVFKPATNQKYSLSGAGKLYNFYKSDLKEWIISKNITNYFVCDDVYDAMIEIEISNRKQFLKDNVITNIYVTIEKPEAITTEIEEVIAAQPETIITEKATPDTSDSIDTLQHKLLKPANINANSFICNSITPTTQNMVTMPSGVLYSLLDTRVLNPIKIVSRDNLILLSVENQDQELFFIPLKLIQSKFKKCKNKNHKYTEDKNIYEIEIFHSKMNTPQIPITVQNFHHLE